ncbi:unnamed protein product [Amoebophrya sp. A25]|nr:unnamed protein product [Amoebophrya sp. A25]|eukprot:GSA25T00021987001.1
MFSRKQTPKAPSSGAPGSEGFPSMDDMDMDFGEGEHYPRGDHPEIMQGEGSGFHPTSMASGVEELSPTRAGASMRVSQRGPEGEAHQRGPEGEGARKSQKPTATGAEGERGGRPDLYDAHFAQNIVDNVFQDRDGLSVEEQLRGRGAQTAAFAAQRHPAGQTHWKDRVKRASILENQQVGSVFAKRQALYKQQGGSNKYVATGDNVPMPGKAKDPRKMVDKSKLLPAQKANLVDDTAYLTQGEATLEDKFADPQRLMGRSSIYEREDRGNVFDREELKEARSRVVAVTERERGPVPKRMDVKDDTSYMADAARQGPKPGVAEKIEPRNPLDAERFAAFQKAVTGDDAEKARVAAEQFDQYGVRFANNITKALHREAPVSRNMRGALAAVGASEGSPEMGSPKTITSVKPSAGFLNYKKDDGTATGVMGAPVLQFPPGFDHRSTPYGMDANAYNARSNLRLMALQLARQRIRRAVSGQQKGIGSQSPFEEGEDASGDAFPDPEKSHPADMYEKELVPAALTLLAEGQPDGNLLLAGMRDYVFFLTDRKATLSATGIETTADHPQNQKVVEAVYKRAGEHSALLEEHEDQIRAMGFDMSASLLASTKDTLLRWSKQQDALRRNPLHTLGKSTHGKLLMDRARLLDAQAQEIRDKAGALVDDRGQVLEEKSKVPPLFSICVVRHFFELVDGPEGRFFDVMRNYAKLRHHHTPDMRGTDLLQDLGRVAAALDAIRAAEKERPGYLKALERNQKGVVELLEGQEIQDVILAVKEARKAKPFLNEGDWLQHLQRVIPQLLFVRKVPLNLLFEAIREYAGQMEVETGQSWLTQAVWKRANQILLFSKKYYEAKAKEPVPESFMMDNYPANFRGAGGEAAAQALRELEKVEKDPQVDAQEVEAARQARELKSINIYRSEGSGMHGLGSAMGSGFSDTGSADDTGDNMFRGDKNAGMKMDASGVGSLRMDAGPPGDRRLDSESELALKLQADEPDLKSARSGSSDNRNTVQDEQQGSGGFGAASRGFGSVGDQQLTSADIGGILDQPEGVDEEIASRPVTPRDKFAGGKHKHLKPQPRVREAAAKYKNPNARAKPGEEPGDPRTRQPGDSTGGDPAGLQGTEPGDAPVVADRRLDSQSDLALQLQAHEPVRPPGEDAVADEELFSDGADEGQMDAYSPRSERSGSARGKSPRGEVTPRSPRTAVEAHTQQVDRNIADKKDVDHVKRRIPVAGRDKFGHIIKDTDKMKGYVRPKYEKYHAIKEAERIAAEEAEAARLAAEEEARRAAEEAARIAEDERVAASQRAAGIITKPDVSHGDAPMGFGHVVKAREKELREELPAGVSDYAARRDAFAKAQQGGIFPTAHQDYYNSGKSPPQKKEYKDLNAYNGSQYRGREIVDAARAAKKRTPSQVQFITDEDGNMMVAPGQKIGKQQKEADAATVEWNIGVNTAGAASISAQGRSDLIKNTALALNPNGFPFWLHLQRVISTFVATREQTPTDELVSALLTYAQELDEQAKELNGIVGYAQVVRRRLPEIRSLCDRKEALDDAFLFIQKEARHEVEAGEGIYPMPSGKIRDFADKYDQAVREEEKIVRAELAEQEHMLKNKAKNEIIRRQAELAADASAQELIEIAEEEQAALEAFLVDQRVLVEQRLAAKRKAGAQAAERYMGELAAGGDAVDGGAAKHLDALRNYAVDRATSEEQLSGEPLVAEVIETAKKLDQIAFGKGHPVGYLIATQMNGGQDFNEMMQEVAEIAAADRAEPERIAALPVPTNQQKEANAGAVAYDPDAHLAVRHPSLYKLVDFTQQTQEALLKAHEKKEPKKEGNADIMDLLDLDEDGQGVPKVRYGRSTIIEDFDEVQKRTQPKDLLNMLKEENFRYEGYGLKPQAPAERQPQRNSLQDMPDKPNVKQMLEGLDPLIIYRKRREQKVAAENATEAEKKKQEEEAWANMQEEIKAMEKRKVEPREIGRHIMKRVLRIEQAEKENGKPSPGLAEVLAKRGPDYVPGYQDARLQQILQGYKAAQDRGEDVPKVKLRDLRDYAAQMDTADAKDRPAPPKDRKDLNSYRKAGESPRGDLGGAIDAHAAEVEAALEISNTGRIAPETMKTLAKEEDEREKAKAQNKTKGIRESLLELDTLSNVKHRLKDLDLLTKDLKADDVRRTVDGTKDKEEGLHLAFREIQQEREALVKRGIPEGTVAEMIQNKFSAKDAASKNKNNEPQKQYNYSRALLRYGAARIPGYHEARVHAVAEQMIAEDPNITAEFAKLQLRKYAAELDRDETMNVVKAEEKYKDDVPSLQAASPRTTAEEKKQLANGKAFSNALKTLEPRLDKEITKANQEAQKTKPAPRASPRPSAAMSSSSPRTAASPRTKDKPNFNEVLDRKDIKRVRIFDRIGDRLAALGKGPKDELDKTKFGNQWEHIQQVGVKLREQEGKSAASQGKTKNEVDIEVARRVVQYTVELEERLLSKAAAMASSPGYITALAAFGPAGLPGYHAARVCETAVEYAKRYPSAKASVITRNVRTYAEEVLDLKNFDDKFAAAMDASLQAIYSEVKDSSKGVISDAADRLRALDVPSKGKNDDENEPVVDEWQAWKRLRDKILPDFLFKQPNITGPQLFSLLEEYAKNMGKAYVAAVKEHKREIEAKGTNPTRLIAKIGAQVTTEPQQGGGGGEEDDSSSSWPPNKIKTTAVRLANQRPDMPGSEIFDAFLEFGADNANMIEHLMDMRQMMIALNADEADKKWRMEALTILHRLVQERTMKHLKQLVAKLLKEQPMMPGELLLEALRSYGRYRLNTQGDRVFSLAVEAHAEEITTEWVYNKSGLVVRPDTLTRAGITDRNLVGLEKLYERYKNPVPIEPADPHGSPVKEMFTQGREAGAFQNQSPFAMGQNARLAEIEREREIRAKQIREGMPMMGNLSDSAHLQLQARQMNLEQHVGGQYVARQNYAAEQAGVRHRGSGNYQSVRSNQDYHDLVNFYARDRNYGRHAAENTDTQFLQNTLRPEQKRREDQMRDFFYLSGQEPPTATSSSSVNNSSSAQSSSGVDSDRSGAISSASESSYYSNSNNKDPRTKDERRRAAENRVRERKPANIEYYKNMLKQQHDDAFIQKNRIPPQLQVAEQKTLAQHQRSALVRDQHHQQADPNFGSPGGGTLSPQQQHPQHPRKLVRTFSDRIRAEAEAERLEVLSEASVHSGASSSASRSSRSSRSSSSLGEAGRIRQSMPRSSRLSAIVADKSTSPVSSLRGSSLWRAEHADPTVHADTNTARRGPPPARRRSSSSRGSSKSGSGVDRELESLTPKKRIKRVEFAEDVDVVEVHKGEGYAARSRRTKSRNSGARKQQTQTTGEATGSPPGERETSSQSQSSPLTLLDSPPISTLLYPKQVIIKRQQVGVGVPNQGQPQPLQGQGQEVQRSVAQPQRQEAGLSGMPPQGTGTPMQGGKNAPQHGLSAPQHGLSAPQHELSAPQHGLSAPHGLTIPSEGPMPHLRGLPMSHLQGLHVQGHRAPLHQELTSVPLHQGLTSVPQPRGGLTVPHLQGVSSMAMPQLLGLTVPQAQVGQGLAAVPHHNADAPDHGQTTIQPQPLWGPSTTTATSPTGKSPSGRSVDFSSDEDSRSGAEAEIMRPRFSAPPSKKASPPELDLHSIVHDVVVQRVGGQDHGGQYVHQPGFGIGDQLTTEMLTGGAGVVIDQPSPIVEEHLQQEHQQDLQQQNREGAHFSAPPGGGDHTSVPPGPGGGFLFYPDEASPEDVSRSSSPLSSPYANAKGLRNVGSPTRPRHSVFNQVPTSPLLAAHMDVPRGTTIAAEIIASAKDEEEVRQLELDEYQNKVLANLSEYYLGHKTAAAKRYARTRGDIAYYGPPKGGAKRTINPLPAGETVMRLGNLRIVTVEPGQGIELSTRPPKAKAPAPPKVEQRKPSAQKKSTVLQDVPKSTMPIPPPDGLPPGLPPGLAAGFGAPPGGPPVPPEDDIDVGDIADMPGGDDMPPPGDDVEDMPPPDDDMALPDDDIPPPPDDDMPPADDDMPPGDDGTPADDVDDMPPPDDLPEDGPPADDADDMPALGGDDMPDVDGGPLPGDADGGSTGGSLGDEPPPPPEDAQSQSQGSEGAPPPPAPPGSIG